MSLKKERVTVTIDGALIKAAKVAVAAGGADSLSAWVSMALAEKVDKERRLTALGSLVTDYEAEHGVITDAQLAARQRADRRNAIVIRGSKRPARAPRRVKAA